MKNNGLIRIEIDLERFIISLFFSGKKESLSLLFNTPSRRFYFSVIAMIVIAMKENREKKFVSLRNLDDLLDFDRKLSGKFASNELDKIYDKIRKAWRYGLSDLRKGKYFKVVDRHRGTPYNEEGASEEYECDESECNAWSNLIGYDEIIGKTWNYRFSVERVGLDLDDVSIKFQHAEGVLAWDNFKKYIDAEYGCESPTPTGVSKLSSTNSAVLDFLESIERDFNQIHLFQTNVKASMQDQYIPIQITCEKEIEHDIDKNVPHFDSSSDFNTELLSQRESLEENINRFDRIMVVGDPGMGKTTFLRMMAWKISRDSIEKLSMKKENIDDILIPIYMSFFDIYQTGKEVYDAIIQIIERDYPRLEESVLEIVKEKILTGRCTILLDALDEIPVREIKQISDKVRRFTKNYGCQLICTSRIIGSGCFFLHDVKEFRITSFGKKERAQYIRMWSRNTGVAAQRLIMEIESEPNLKRFGQNPLLLSFICRFYANKLTAPPERRIEIYCKALYSILEEKSQIRKPSSEFYLAAKRLMLENLAFHFQQKGKDIFSTDELMRWMDQYIENKNSPKIFKSSNVLELLHEISVDDGIIIKNDAQGRGYKFSYRIFQEILTASYLVRIFGEKPENGLSLVKKYLWEFNWHETIVLTAGLMEDPLVLIKSIIEEDDDVFSSLLILAGRCIAEAKNNDHPILNDVIMELYEFSKKSNLFNYRYIAPTIYALGKAGTSILDLLYKDYKNGNKIQRLIACGTLGQTGHQKALSHLEKALKDQEQSVRELALRYLLEVNNIKAINYFERNFYDLDRDTIGAALHALKVNESDEILTSLKKALNHWNSDVRKIAVEILSKICTNEAYQLLNIALDDDNIKVRLKVIESVGGVETDDVLKLLSKAILDNDPPVRRAAINYLGKIRTDETQKLIRNTITDGDATVRSIAIKFLTENEGNNALDFLEEFLHDHDPIVRSVTVECLGDLGTNDAFELLLEALNDDDGSVRSMVVQYLGKMEASKVLIHLSKALRDEYLGVKLSAIRSLKEIRSSEAIELLYRGFADEDYAVRSLAFKSLVEIGTDNFFELLHRAVRDNSGYIRSIAVTYLERMESNIALKILRKTLYDSEVSVRQATTGVLGKICTNEALNLLEKALSDKEALVRKSAVKSICDIGTNRALGLLVKALSDQSEYVRWAAAEAIGSFGTKEAQNLLVTMLEDKDRKLNVIAAYYLAGTKNTIIIDPLISILKEEKGILFKTNVQEMAIEALEIVGSMQVVKKLNENQLINYGNPDIYALVQRLVFLNCTEDNFEPVFVTE